MHNSFDNVLYVCIEGRILGEGENGGDPHILDLYLRYRSYA